MQRFLPIAPVGIALCLTTAYVMNPVFAKDNPQAPFPFTFTAKTVRTASTNSSNGTWHKGDYFLYGIPGHPARINSPELSLTAPIIIFGKNRSIISNESATERVTIKCSIVPKQGGLPLRFEATCEEADFDYEKGIWNLSGDVQGFYETAKARKPLSGDAVTISRLASTVSITQQTTENAGGNQ